MSLSNARRTRLPWAVVGIVGLACGALIGVPQVRAEQKQDQQTSTEKRQALQAQLERAPRAMRDMMSLMSPLLPGPDFPAMFDLKVERVRMRDGVELHTEIYTPKNLAKPLPIIYERTPYGLHQDAHGYTVHLRTYPELIKEGYIFVFQDTRGKGASGGKYITSPPQRDKSIPNSVDDSTDAYDTIDWLVRNVRNNNGRVGTLGISYGGYLTTRALVDPHPALKAASPQATCADMFIGDDWHHNGAFRLDYSFGWIAAMEVGSGAMPQNHDAYERFLELGPLSNVNEKYFHGKAPSWNAFAEHPNRDSFWTVDSCGILQHIQPVTVPTLTVAGYFDAEDFYGPMTSYRKYESLDSKGLNYLVIGPWYHGGWSFSPEGRWLGDVDFGQNTAQWFRRQVQARWFAYWLKHKGTLDMPEVMAYRTGTNQWERYDSWPPRQGIDERKLYLHANGSLSFEPPSAQGGETHDDYVSDPAKPVPYLPRPITRASWPEWQAVDQRFVDGRPDVLTYRSEPLSEDLTVTGDAVANLFAATTGSDSDWVVKLIDVYPEDSAEPHMRGYQLMVAGEVFRGRYRNSFENPEPVTPGQVTHYKINLRDRNHTFKAGHRLMVQIQSSWFPVIDRNPQRYVPNIYNAVEADFQKATQSIYRTGEQASYISLPVNTRPVVPLPATLKAQ